MSLPPGQSGATGGAAPHVPVLLAEVIAGLAVSEGETHVDGTFGAGGYTRAILEKGAARVFAFDRDPDAIQYGEELAASSGGRLTLVPERFSRMRQALAELENGLEAAEQVLRPGGRLAIVTFHSLEDRMVKRFLTLRSGKMAAGSRHLPERRSTHPEPSFEAVAKAVRAGEDETKANPRARSATLRVARRTSAKAWNAEGRPE